MRKIIAISALSALASSAAVGGYLRTRSPDEAMTADLERDLRLATTVQPQRSAVVSAIEQGRNGAPSGREAGRRMVVPTSRRAPAPRPSSSVSDAATDPAEATEPASTAAPAVSEPVAVVASVPEPVVAPAPEPAGTTAASVGGPSATNGGNSGRNSGDAGRGSEGRRGSAVGAVGTVVGVILRGGAAGHDNCEPASRRRRGIGSTGSIIGAIGEILASGTGARTGTIPAGTTPQTGRRW